MTTRIVGLGQPFAGDDSAGLAVLAELRRRGVPPGIELIDCNDPLVVVPLLIVTERVVIVDALMSETAGNVVEPKPASLSASQPISSHALGGAEALALARAVYGDDALPEIRIVAVTIAVAHRYRVGLSPEVASAIPQAADRALALASFSCPVVTKDSDDGSEPRNPQDR